MFQLVDYYWMLMIEHFTLKSMILMLQMESDRWKVRNQIYLKKKMHDEGRDTDEGAATSWKNNALPALLQDYSSSCIYNCDKTTLYYKAMPDETLCVKGEKVAGGKISKDRLAVLCCSNADGSHKMPLFIVGKSKKPRCFRGVKSLPVK